MGEERSDNVGLSGPSGQVEGTRTLVVGAVARGLVAEQKFHNVTIMIF
jgi:hypothetical protein